MTRKKKKKTTRKKKKSTRTKESSHERTWTLGNDGDYYERHWWRKLMNSFPNYEIFWQKNIVPLTMRVINPANIWLRPSVPDFLADLATASYNTFSHLTQAHEELQDSARLTRPVGFYSFYSHLYTIVDATLPMFLSAVNRILDNYNIPIFPKSRNKERFKFRGKPTLSDDVKDFCDRVKPYRGLLVHNYTFIFVSNKKVPRPECADKYTSLLTRTKILENPSLIDTDFENIKDRCESDILELEEILNQVWDVALKELESLPIEYKEDQEKISERDITIDSAWVHCKTDSSGIIIVPPTI